MSASSTAAGVVIAAAAVGSGAVAGVFFAFSGFVMPALDRLTPAQATGTMQSINVTAVRPPLMIALFGTAALVIAAPLLARRGGDQPAALLLTAGAIYLIGTVGTTIVGNVPLNDALAHTAAATTDAATWSAWSSAWRARNHVRTAAALAATALYATALLRTVRG